MNKKNYLKQLACALASLALAACQNTLEVEMTPATPMEKAPAAKVKTIYFQTEEIVTKTTFGEKENGHYPTLWTDNDQAVKLALNFTQAGTASIVPDEGRRTASFQADIDASVTEAPYTFYAVSPASAATALSPSREAWNISIPCVQTPLEGSVDEAAQILAAASEASTTLPDRVNLHFNHLTAYGRISFKNLALGDANVLSVELTTSTPIVGDWYWNCNEGHTLTDNGASSTLTLNTSRTEDIWFACAPVDMSGQKMVVTVFTDQGAFVKEIQFPENRQFTSGLIAVFSVNMAGIELQEGGHSGEDYRLVTQTTDLKDGDELLILSASEDYALSATQNNNNRPAKAINVTNHAVATVPSGVQVLTLVAGSTSGTWHLSTGSGYLANKDGYDNRLVTVSSKTKNATWTISISSTGVATLTAGSGVKNKIRYNPNNNSPIFSCYSNGQKDVVIYRKTSLSTIGPVEADPLTTRDEYGCYLSVGTWQYAPGENQFVRSYDDQGILTFALLDPNGLRQIEIKGYKKSLAKGDNVTLSVTWRSGITPILTDMNYSMKVVKEEGSKVWLGDGSGLGFIIKK